MRQPLPDDIRQADVRHLQLTVIIVAGISLIFGYLGCIVLYRVGGVKHACVLQVREIGDFRLDRDTLAFLTDMEILECKPNQPYNLRDVRAVRLDNPQHINQQLIPKRLVDARIGRGQDEYLRYYHNQIPRQVRYRVDNASDQPEDKEDT